MTAVAAQIVYKKTTTLTIEETRMSDGNTPENREALISALAALADAIEANPPPVIGSDIFVHAGARSNVIGSSISMEVGPGGGSGVGQRVSVVSKSGQPVIGQRVRVVVGDGSVEAPPSGARSSEEIDSAVTQLRDAAKALASSPASETWIKSILQTVSGWGDSAFNGTISGVTGAAAAFYYFHH